MQNGADASCADLLGSGTQNTKPAQAADEPKSSQDADSFASRASTEAAPTTHIEPTRLEKAIGARIDIGGYGTGKLARELKMEAKAAREEAAGYQPNYL